MYILKTISNAKTSRIEAMNGLEGNNYFINRNADTIDDWTYKGVPRLRFEMLHIEYSFHCTMV